MVTARKTTAKAHKPEKPGHHDNGHDSHDDDRNDHGAANITLSIRLGPMVSFQVQGRNCGEINAALKGFEQLNRTVDAMFSDLAKRVYPDAGHAGDKE